MNDPNRLCRHLSEGRLNDTNTTDKISRWNDLQWPKGFCVDSVHPEVSNTKKDCEQSPRIYNEEALTTCPMALRECRRPVSSSEPRCIELEPYRRHRFQNDTGSDMGHMSLQCLHRQSDLHRFEKQSSFRNESRCDTGKDSSLLTQRRERGLHQLPPSCHLRWLDLAI